MFGSEVFYFIPEQGNFTFVDEGPVFGLVKKSVNAVALLDPRSIYSVFHFLFVLNRQTYLLIFLKNTDKL